MTIEQTDEETIKMLDVIVDFPVTGVIFGNLQKNRKDKALNQDEVKKFPVGNFSGKPTEQRSNELIELSYKKYGKKLVIIGCGGIFNAQDAYKKIRLGATLVQLITGLIFEGPQLIAQINIDLDKFLKRDGFSNISEAIGKDSN
jgi:dihydroorotate dehydrogenase